MISRIIPIVPGILFCAISAFDAVATEESIIHAVRVAQVPHRTRVVLDQTKPVSPVISELDNPQRLVLELSNTVTAVDFQELQLSGTPISRVRAVATANSGLKIVFELHTRAEPEVFLLKPYIDKGHRLVVDFHSSPQGTAATVIDNSIAEETVVANQEVSGVVIDERSSDVEPVTASGRRVDADWSGYISLDARLFPENPSYAEQDEQNASVALEPEYYIDWADGEQRFVFHPFFRYDANDDERTHADLRELYWRKSSENVEIKIGIGHVFWGVTESQHLVDIINQTDLVENIDGEDKLGQPMLDVSLNRSWGSLSLFVLPWFRERTFPGRHGRLRTDPPIDTDSPLYESGDEEKHIDYAIRWSHYIGDIDIGIAHFSGTAREPLIVGVEVAGEVQLLPFYQQIDQTSLDLQATQGDWLWKLEAIVNQNNTRDYFASVAGFEYTWVGVGDGPSDLGWLLEYHFDDRDEKSTLGLQNDLYAGVRWTLNDAQSTQALAGVIVDLDTNSVFANVEASRRFGESWRLSVEARFFSNLDQDDILYSFRNDDYVEIQIARYF